MVSACPQSRFLLCAAESATNLTPCHHLLFSFSFLSKPTRVWFCHQRPSLCSPDFCPPWGYNHPGEVTCIGPRAAALQLSSSSSDYIPEEIKVSPDRCLALSPSPADEPCTPKSYVWRCEPSSGGDATTLGCSDDWTLYEAAVLDRGRALTCCAEEAGKYEDCEVDNGRVPESFCPCPMPNNYFGYQEGMDLPDDNAPEVTDPFASAEVTELIKLVNDFEKVLALSASAFSDQPDFSSCPGYLSALKGAVNVAAGCGVSDVFDIPDAYAYSLLVSGLYNQVSAAPGMFSCYGAGGGFNPLPSGLTYVPPVVPAWCGKCSDTFIEAYRAFSEASCFAPLYNSAIIEARGGAANPKPTDPPNAVFNAMIALIGMNLLPTSAAGAWFCATDCDGISPCSEQRVQRSDLKAWWDDNQYTRQRRTDISLPGGGGGGDPSLRQVDGGSGLCSCDETVPCIDSAVEDGVPACVDMEEVGCCWGNSLLPISDVIQTTYFHLSDIAAGRNTPQKFDLTEETVSLDQSKMITKVGSTCGIEADKDPVNRHKSISAQVVYGTAILNGLSESDVDANGNGLKVLTSAFIAAMTAITRRGLGLGLSAVLVDYTTPLDPSTRARRSMLGSDDDDRRMNFEFRVLVFELEKQSDGARAATYATIKSNIQAATGDSSDLVERIGVALGGDDGARIVREAKVEKVECEKEYDVTHGTMNVLTGGTDTEVEDDDEDDSESEGLNASSSGVGGGLLLAFVASVVASVGMFWDGTAQL